MPTPFPSEYDGHVMASWVDFRSALAELVAEMHEDDLLTLDPVWETFPTDRGVQCFCWSEGTIRLEIPSNHYLTFEDKLTVDDEQWLVDAGLNPPSGRPGSAGDGSPAFWLDTAPRYADRIADIAVRVLRDLWGIPHPAFVKANTPGSSRALDLAAPAPTESRGFGLTVPTQPESPADLRSLLIDTLSDGLDFHIDLDGDGDPVLRLNGGIVHIWPADDEPAVQVLTTLLRGVTDRSRIVEPLSEFNRTHRYFHAELVGESLVVQHTFPAAPFVPQHLVDVLATLSGILDTVDDDFVARFGGRSARMTTDHECEDDELPEELVHLAELDPEGSGFLDIETVLDVCGQNKATLQRFIEIAHEQERSWLDNARTAITQAEPDEAASCRHEADGWANTTKALQRALAFVSRHPSTNRVGQPQLELFSPPTDPTLFDEWEIDEE
ncbi:hypothetical protein DW322_17715 [Rhodococcus rhodnii]|nr:hypothetical protein [Rhodococcus rhodnii]TXG91691.1 hypothetical protein DW322_17715 [Rhodococcus rhodnii]